MLFRSLQHARLSPARLDFPYTSRTNGEVDRVARGDLARDAIDLDVNIDLAGRGPDEVPALSTQKVMG